MQGEKLSYSRLISRTKYFQEKSLELEKELIFANDQLATLEKQLESTKDHESTIAHLKEELTKLEGTLETQTQELIEMKNEVDVTKKANSRTEDTTKIKGYEDLLAEMQIEINEKDKRLQHYQGKIKNLEKKAQFLPTEKVAEVEAKPTEIADHFAVSYFNTSIIILDKQSVMIRGDLQIENCGVAKLTNPLVCFRFSPSEMATLKGRIYPIEVAETKSLDSSDRVHWVFPDHDGLDKAKEKGEIWVSPLHPVTLHPGDKIAIESFQIPIKSEFKEPVIIEGFVYFQSNNYRIKVSNQIALSY
ncbi:hypothetical protein [Pseudalkalibacillus hwajinpoensis]|uniref:hypothetical protein n=1 Tax=Guptibacillus hwajinpoensis TaxID=208199 RepID=UPI001CD6DD75|nr:hypothetical protein [Pseudalkalibacillus hwajinpoensis]MCA0990019.1 hypothetical protein [Pseudalkalibacillus hwajinpoensis]